MHKPWQNTGSTPCKVMHCVWWDWSGIVHQELLQPGQMIDSIVYYKQIMGLNCAIVVEWPDFFNMKGAVLNHNNARPNISLMNRQKLRRNGQEVLMHPPYSADVTSSAYYLFRSLQYNVISVKLASNDACENHIFAKKSEQFYSDGIIFLQEKWQKVKTPRTFSFTQYM